jgi:hypothetical protein
MKKFLFRIKLGLYNKIEAYKEENDFPSIAYTIRFIITQFLKNK